MAARTLAVEGAPTAVAAFAGELQVGDYSPRVSGGRLTCRLPGQVEFDAWREAAVRRHLTPCQRSPKPTAPILATALRRAKAGDRVVPVAGIVDGHCACPRGRGCSRPGKHPLVHDWIAAATTNPATIREWWSKWSGANLGVTLSDQVAIDIDGPEPEAVLARCLVEHGPLPEGHGHERTGRGRHLVMGCPPGMEAASIPGLDVLSGPHHLLVVAPSIHVSGATYTEVQCRDLQTMAPGWCLRPIPTPAPTPTTAHQIGIATIVGAEMLQRAMQEVATTPRDGHLRNITLHRWAYTLGGAYAGEGDRIWSSSGTPSSTRPGGVGWSRRTDWVSAGPPSRPGGGQGYAGRSRCRPHPEIRPTSRSWPGSGLQWRIGSGPGRRGRWTTGSWTAS